MVRARHGYAYAENNPTSYADPDGQMKFIGDSFIAGGGPEGWGAAAAGGSTNWSNFWGSTRTTTTGARGTRGSRAGGTRATEGWATTTNPSITARWETRIVRAEKAQMRKMAAARAHTARTTSTTTPATPRTSQGRTPPPRTATTTNGSRRQPTPTTSTNGNRGCGHSFTPDTPVLMADGSSKPISNIQAGDQVIATDPDTGSSTAQPVEQTHTNTDTELTTLTITTSNGTTATLHTTQNHPFWDQTTKQWVDAAHLAPGHELLTSTGERAKVTAVASYTGRQAMHDLTVTDIHTYYVLAGDTPVLVHNCPPGQSSSPPSAPNRVRDAVEQIRNGTLSQRTNPDGTPDVFVPRTSTPPRVARRWGGAQIYEVPGMGDQYRILVNNYGEIGWTSNHYLAIHNFVP